MPVSAVRRVGIGVCDRGENSRSKPLELLSAPLAAKRAWDFGDSGARSKPPPVADDGDTGPMDASAGSPVASDVRDAIAAATMDAKGSIVGTADVAGAAENAVPVERILSKRPSRTICVKNCERGHTNTQSQLGLPLPRGRKNSVAPRAETNTIATSFHKCTPRRSAVHVTHTCKHRAEWSFGNSGSTALIMPSVTEQSTALEDAVGPLAI